MSNQYEKFQKGLIITDNSSNQPILDFDSYSNAIVKIIKNSYPDFTIGIYGDWGTGKTTLMKSIKNLLETSGKEKIITVWFDAWKYENEKEFALIPLLKTINYSIKDETDEKIKDLKEAIKESLIFTIGISRNIISSIVTNFAGKQIGDLAEQGLEAVTNKLIPQLREAKELSEMDNNTIFYNGIKNIQDAISKIREDPDFRLVIFIDDLDRCSEEKVLEILQSIKIFLSLNGIIHVLGINHKQIVELIKKKYQIDQIDAEQFLEKFIQIPINPAEWNESDIKSLIQDLLDKKIIHDDYRSIIEENKMDIVTAIQKNPRKIKRFLNNLIISYEVFVDIQKIDNIDKKKTFLKQLLLVQILKTNWEYVYHTIVNSNGKVLVKLEPYIFSDKKIIKAFINEEKSEDELELKKILQKCDFDKGLLDFLRANFDPLESIEDWNIFRRALKVGEEKLSSPEEIVLKLLKDGKIKEFNEKRKSFKDLNLVGVDLRNADLRDARLAGEEYDSVNFEKANFDGADLRGADLQETNFRGASFVNANLHGAKISEAILDNANLSGANLSETDFADTYLNKATLVGAILCGVRFGGWAVGSDFSNSIIINPMEFKYFKVDQNTDFSNAIIDDPLFISYLKSKYPLAKNIPEAITDKKFLKTILEQKRLSDDNIRFILEKSNLPD